MNSYNLSRIWFSFAYENAGVKPVHTALYFWILERGNASGWKKIIDIQTEKSMECLGVTDWRTYKSALQFLSDNGFIMWVEKSKNQYTCNKVTLIQEPSEIGQAYKNASALNVKADAEAVAEALAEAYAEAEVKAIAEALQSYINLKTLKPIKPLNPKKEGETVAEATPLKNDIDEPKPPKEATQTKGASENLHKQFTDTYVEFYKNEVGVEPDFTAADGVAAAKLKKYLVKISNTKDELGAINGLKYIFENWKKLEPFLQQQLKLTQINSNINNILNQIKNGLAKKQPTNQISDKEITEAARNYNFSGH